MKKIALIITLLLTPSLKISADEILSPHTMGHILGGIGSFFLGPLPGIGLSILPELLDGAEIKSHEGMVFGRMYADWKLRKGYE